MVFMMLPITSTVYSKVYCRNEIFIPSNQALVFMAEVSPHRTSMVMNFFISPEGNPSKIKWDLSKMGWHVSHMDLLKVARFWLSVVITVNIISMGEQKPVNHLHFLFALYR